MALEIVPISLRGANAYVRDHHRHHKPAVGHKFSIACADGDKIVGVAIVGRPVSRHLDDYWTLEVNRLCTDGTRNACSMLYAAAWRVARAMGYKRLVTYILESEPGTSLKADELIKALERLKVQTGSLACLGCGHEHNCSVHGCAIMREAAVRLSLYEHALEQASEERDKAVKQLKRQAECDTCKHDHPCGMDGEPCTSCTTGQHWDWDGGTPHD